MQFSGNFKGKPPILSKFLGSGGQNSTRPPPDQNPGSAPGHARSARPVRINPTFSMHRGNDMSLSFLSCAWTAWFFFLLFTFFKNCVDFWQFLAVSIPHIYTNRIAFFHPFLFWTIWTKLEIFLLVPFGPVSFRVQSQACNTGPHRVWMPWVFWVFLFVCFNFNFNFFFFFFILFFLFINFFFFGGLQRKFANV